MHIDIIPNRGSNPTVLLRESYREGKKVKKRTLANLSSLPMEKVEMIRQVLSGEITALLPIPAHQEHQHHPSRADIYESIAPAHHRHVQAMHGAMKQLGMEDWIGSRSSRERTRAVGTARKAGLSSTLAATIIRGTLNMDPEFRVR